jgi:AcrR family transcriptional regulator
MARTPDDTIRADLLKRAIEYVCRHGLNGLSLRPLAKAIGSSSSLLLYHFKSKEALVMAVIKAVRERQQRVMSRLDETTLSQGEVGRMLWREYSSPRYEPSMRLFFEVYALALQDRSRFPGFLKETVGHWLDAIEASLPAAGTPQARIAATIMLDAFRGFLLDLYATRDRARIDAAVDEFFTMLDANPLAQGRRAAS